MYKLQQQVGIPFTYWEVQNSWNLGQRHSLLTNKGLTETALLQRESKRQNKWPVRRFPFHS